MDPAPIGRLMLASAMQSTEHAGTLFWQAALLLLLLLCNAFFAASETAIISLNDAKIRKMAEDGDKKAKKVLSLTKDTARFLSTVQIGITLAGFLTAAAAAHDWAPRLVAWALFRFPSWQTHAQTVEILGVVLVTVLIAYLSLLLGEQVPRRMAAGHPEKTAFAVVGALHVLTVCLRPLERLLFWNTNGILRLCGIDPHADDEKVTEEEIRMLVDVGEEKGVIEEVQKDMINNIFEFDDITAGEIMTPRTDVEAVDLEDGLAEALRIAVDEGFSRLPVYEEDIDHIIGILHIKDLLPYVGQALPKAVTLRNLLRETYFVPETKHCGELFSEMTAKHLQMAVVVDEYGGVAGIVSMEDLLESIVGSMQDEFDNEEEEITQIDETSFVVDGSTSLEEVGERIGKPLPEGDYETVAGFLMQQLGRIPAADEHPQTQFENVLFTVQRMDDRRIDEVHIELLPCLAEEET